MMSPMRKAFLPQPRTAAGYVLNKRSLLPIQSMTNFVYVGTKGQLSPRVRGETQAGRESCENTIGIDLQDA